MSTDTNDVQYLRCLKCMQIIKCSRYDTNVLLDHVQKVHPEIISNASEKVQNLYKLAAEHGISEERMSEISKKTGLTEEEMADKAERYVAEHKLPQQEQPEQQESAKSKNKSNRVQIKLKPPTHKDSNELSLHHLYRSSIERWNPTEGAIYCPKCGHHRRPQIKSSAEFYASTGCSAACVANCWPFCFLPCLNAVDNREYLHCPNCKTFMGIYDRENNCIRPNREFVHLKPSKKIA